MAWSLNDLVEAVSYITGQATDKLKQLKELAKWTWEVLQGDFNEDQDVSHIAANTALSIGVTATGIGVLVAWLMDLRDLIANAYHIYNSATKDGKMDFSKVDKLLWFALIATLIGVIPALGDLAKGVFRIIIIFFKRAMRVAKHTDAVKLMAKAIDDAIPYIAELLNKPLVKKWLTSNKWYRPFMELSKAFKKIKPLITKNYIMSLFDDCVKKLKEIIKHIYSYLPSGASKKIDDLYKKLDKVRAELNEAIAKLIKPVQDCMDVIIIRLEKQDYVAYTARTGKINEHYFGRVALGSKAWKEARHAGYLVASKKIPFAPTTYAKNIGEIEWAIKRRGWPKISESNVETFHRIAAVEIKGSAKLYRVVDPESRADGLFWMTEKDFTNLKTRQQWRTESAVKEEWNSNGQYVEYEIKAGETLKVWQGPAASQQYEGNLWYKGGGDQVVFYPEANRVSSRKATGWGYLDRDEQLLNARILVDLSGKKM